MKSLSPRSLLPAGFLLVLIVVAAFILNRGYGKVSPDAYKYATALYSVCNRRDEVRLSKLDDLIRNAAGRGEISESEFEWLQAILEDARDGDWESAQAESRKLLVDQSDAP